MTNKMNKHEWNQIEVIHCKDYKCQGMLLQHPLYYIHKCSECGKTFERCINWKEIKNFKEQN